jgi:HemY protein
MIRVLLYLVIVGLIALGAVWLADRPGTVAITWQGERLETSVMVLAASAVALAAAAIVLWSLLRAMVRAPHILARRRRARRNARGYRAMTQGFVSVGSGDVRAARRFTNEAKRLAPNEALTLLLTAQSAQLSGDGAAAAASFQQMAGRSDTRVLGLHGLFVEAQRRNDPAAALAYAEAAAKSDSGSVPAWAGQAVLEFRCSAGDWAGALDWLEHNMRSGLIDKLAYRRQRAVLLTAQALAVEESESLPTSGKADVGRERARALALEAVKLAPQLIPAAALAGRLLNAAGERRKAARIVEAAWRANPHPDLAEAYVRPPESAREKLTRIEELAALAPGDAEAAIAVARAALAAKEFEIGRKALAPFTASPTKRVAALMAALELQAGDEGRGREWMARSFNARRDPAWTADGFVSDRWLPVSPVTGKLDAFEWKDPLAGEEHAGAVIDAERHVMLEPPTAKVASAAAATAALAAAASAAGAATAASVAPADPAVAVETVRPPPPPPLSASELRERLDAAAPAPDESREPVEAHADETATSPPPVIPLVHAPDDPGPDGAPAVDSAAEPSAEPTPEGRSRFRSLFRP